MTELLTPDAFGLLLVSLGVGIVVGLTGMGGGALMTPALILLGIPPTTAVANDLVAASVNKSVGAAVHWRAGSPNMRLAGYLVVGSVPMAFAGAFIIDGVGEDAAQQQFVKLAIGATLLITSATYITRIYIEFRRKIFEDHTRPDPPIRPLRTIAIGAVGGLLVGLTSVGSGSLIMVALLLLYPMLSPVRLVGTDLVQAIPLVASAAISHVIVSGVDWAVLVPLIVGGTPGTFLGAKLASIVPVSVVRRGIAIVLTLTGLAMLGVPPVTVGIIGAGLLILGPVAWVAVRELTRDHLVGAAPQADHATAPADGRSPDRA
jgi:uncharacterized membrane protein YfcA